MARGRGVRVIAGTARGRRLETPRGDRTRPMMDRAREAVFSALDARGKIREAAVLDLYAGSGSLAVEALSRGASRAVLVEADPSAARIAAANLELAGFATRATVVTGRVEIEMDRTIARTAPFDLVFFDPPYSLEDRDAASLLASVCESGRLRDDAIVVVHRRDRLPDLPDGRMVLWERRYGDTLLALVASSAGEPG